MAIQYGESAAKHVIEGQVSCGTGAWTALNVGSAPLDGRTRVRIFVRGNIGMSLALAYANKNSSGGFTTPTTTVHQTTVVAGGSYFIEPLTDSVQLYGRLIKKAGATDSSVKVIVTEYR